MSKVFHSWQSGIDSSLPHFLGQQGWPGSRRSGFSMKSDFYLANAFKMFYMRKTGGKMHHRWSKYTTWIEKDGQDGQEQPQTRQAAESE